MALRIVQVIVKDELRTSLEEIIKRLDIVDWWIHDNDDNRVTFSLLTPIDHTQHIVDTLQTVINFDKEGRLLILPLEATLPISTEKEKINGIIDKRWFFSIPRETLYNQIADEAKLTGTYVLLVMLSAIVASLGMLENNIAVLIGAMVIAPLLGPNLATAFSTAIGDLKLLWQSLLANGAGAIIALACSIIIGLSWPFPFNSPALLTQPTVGYAGVMIALASGAAAVLSLTSGLSSVLVGVMLAVALLPPLCATGLFLGTGLYSLALGSLVIFAVNIVSIIFAANIVFLFKGISPYRWHEKQKAKKTVLWQTTILFIFLILLLMVI